MGQPAEKRLSVAEFLRWNPNDGRRYELVDGIPVAQAAPSDDHAAILGAALQAALRRSGLPCRVETGSGVQPNNRPGAYYLIPDIVVRCREGGEGARRPVVIVEILSPSNSDAEMDAKRVAYKSLPTVQEIVLLRQDRFSGQVHRRDGPRWVIDELLGPEARLKVEAADLDLPLSVVYVDVLPPEHGPQF